MINDRTYFWVYDPSYYEPAQLSGFINLLQKGINIKPLEIAKASKQHILSLSKLANQNININPILKFNPLPSPGVMEYVLTKLKNHPNLIKYVTPSMDLNTLKWIMTWLDTPNETALAKFLKTNLNWAQLESLSKIEIAAITARNANQPHLNANLLIPYQLSHDTLDRLLTVFESTQIDLTKYISKLSIKNFETLVFAVSSGIHEDFFKLPIMDHFKDATYDILGIYYVYNKTVIDKFIKRINPNTDPNKLFKILKRATKISEIHSRYPTLFNDLNSGIAKRLTNLN